MAKRGSTTKVAKGAKGKAGFHSWGELVGLEGLPERVPAWTAGTRAGLVRVLKAKRVATTAGDQGSITVWRVKAGVFRCSFCRYMQRLSEETVTSIAAVARWLKEWWPRMEKA